MSSIKEKVKNNLQITLVNPQVPDNIGLVARVMKNTGFHNLALVEPGTTVRSFQVAKRAKDLLEKAKTFSSLQEALDGSAFVIGTTRRPREFRFVYSFEDIKTLVVSMAYRQKVNIIFGREDFGLSNEELARCDSVFYLPAAQDFSSYNLASSVGIICYSLLVLTETIVLTQSLELAKKKDINSFFLYLEKLIAADTPASRLPSIVHSLKRIALRTHLTRSEVSLLKALVVQGRRNRRPVFKKEKTC